MNTKQLTDSASGPAYNDKRIAAIIAAARKYDRTLRRFHCRFDEKSGNFVYDIVVAKRGSGSRGACLRGAHYYTLTNLLPEQRERLETSIRREKEAA